MEASIFPEADLEQGSLWKTVTKIKKSAHYVPVKNTNFFIRPFCGDLTTGTRSWRRGKQFGEHLALSGLGKAKSISEPLCKSGFSQWAATVLELCINLINLRNLFIHT